jgi:hypothetical protein
MRALRHYSSVQGEVLFNFYCFTDHYYGSFAVYLSHLEDLLEKGNIDSFENYIR